MSTAPDGILETLTMVVSLDVQQPRTQGSLCAGRGTRLDVQQDVVSVEKKNWSVLVFVLVASSEIFHQNTDENNLSDDDNDGGLLFELDGDDTGFDGIF
jgi:hypothetical protein